MSQMILAPLRRLVHSGRLVAFLVGLCFSGYAQNYVLTHTYKNGDANQKQNVAQTTTQVQYLDGLGRPIQTVSVGQSPSGKDLILHQQYDAYGREPLQFLPFTEGSASGLLRSNAASLQSNFYASNVPQLSADDLGRPYQETAFESSPLNRPLSQRGAGTQSESSAVVYAVNSGSSGEWAVKQYSFVEHSTLTQTVTGSGYYGNGQLSMVKMTDEGGKVSWEAKDKEGRVVLKRSSVAGNTYADTYYVYDDLGQLRAVLQPMYQTETNASKYAFLYRYDSRGRLVEKQVPGAESVEMRYDQYDRLVLSRDGNQRNRGVWGFTKYDALNRPIVTGEVPNANAPSEADLLSNGHHETPTLSGSLKYTLNATLPLSVSENDVLTATYYDSYDNWGALPYVNQYGLSAVTNVKGQTTGSRTRMLEAAGTYGPFLVETIYYDANYRSIQTAKELFGFSGEDRVLRVSSKYKYEVSAIVEREHQQQGTIKTEKVYNYDHADRLLSVQHQVWRNNVAEAVVVVAAMDYNELGQLSSKWLHSVDGSSFLRKQGYVYNIRGWQTESKAEHLPEGQTTPVVQFGYQLGYLGSTGKYSNGNLSTLSWTHAATATLGSISSSYSFSYDGLNRLLSTGTGGNHEGGMGYDLNGNLTALKRWQSGTLIDDLTYEYQQGNRLHKIDDSSGNAGGFTDVGGADYAYDANGNLTQDLNKGIGAGNLRYNVLNLVRQITIGSNTLSYDYDASGQKHQLVYENVGDASKSERTRYAGSVEWEGANVKRISTGEGQYVVKEGSVGEYEYYLTDHLGNVRVVLSDEGEVLQRSDYYAFGLPLNAVDRGINKYTYNGKELQPQTGLLDYGARQYDAAVGRWFGVDALAEKLPFSSPYVFALNNPLKYIDPDGAFPILIGTRAFAPFDWFGASTWKGDGNNRRFSTADNQGFRIAQNTRYETTTQIASNEALGARSESSYGANAFSDAEVSPASSKGNRLVSHLSGDNDALIPGKDGLGFGMSPTWDIDVHTDFTVNVTNGKDGNQMLNISGAIGGDLFPSVESFVKDAKGNGVFLGVVPANYGPSDGPFRGLGGDKRAEGTKVNVSIMVNKEGHFMGVMQNGKMISTQEWNKQFEKQNPVNVGANRNGG